MSAFTIRFTDINAETGETFGLYETVAHGWGSTEDFIAHLKRYKGRDRVVEFFDTGYAQITENGLTKQRVEIVAA